MFVIFTALVFFKPYIFKMLQNIKIKFFQIFFNLKQRVIRSGFTLLEMSIAVGSTASIMIAVLSMISLGLNQQREAENLRLAVILSQGKLSQLLTRPDLSPATEEGEISNENSLYKGYKYKIEISNKEIDLAQIAESGTISLAPIKDKLPENITNTSQKETMGQGAATQTGGMVEVMEIRVEISYPRGNGSSGKYEVVTFKRKSL